MFEILADLTGCGQLSPLILFLRKGIFPIIQLAIPIILIIMGSIDLGRAVLSSDDKQIKEATGRLLKRAIAAVAVFFVTTLVYLLMGMFGSAETGIDTGTDVFNWKTCWESAGK